MTKQIITRKSLNAVEELVLFMKQNLMRREALFQGPGHNVTVRQIANELQRGGNNLRILLDDGLVEESAAALEIFLTNLKYPFIPIHIQALALDDSEGVQPEIVAQDMLGLLKQDVSGRHYRLIVIILDLLHYLLKHTPADELTGYNIPISMMPIFFNLQAQHLAHWRRVATVFVELIRMAPTYLQFTVETEYGDDVFFENKLRDLAYNVIPLVWSNSIRDSGNSVDLKKFKKLFLLTTIYKFKKEIMYTSVVQNVISCIDALNIIHMLDMHPKRIRNRKGRIFSKNV